LKIGGEFDMIYLGHHLGLGDHIICNAIVREYSKRGDLTIFCKEQYYESIYFLHRDLKNLHIVKVKEHSDIFEFLRDKDSNSIIIIGYGGKNWPYPNMTYNENFYLQAGISFEKRWTSFYFERDIERENKLFDSLNINQPYIVLHEDKTRNYVIDRMFVKNRNIISIDISLTNNIFDYYKVFENAEEIHVIESCFLFLIDSIELKNKPLFAHRYARVYDWFNLPTLKKPWIIL